MTTKTKNVQGNIVLVHKNMIRTGDTIICNDGIERTVCQENIKLNNLVGISIFGDCYNAGYKLVRKREFKIVQ